MNLRLKKLIIKLVIQLIQLILNYFKKKLKETNKHKIMLHLIHEKYKYNFAERIIIFILQELLWYISDKDIKYRNKISIIRCTSEKELYGKDT